MSKTKEQIKAAEDRIGRLTPQVVAVADSLNIPRPRSLQTPLTRADYLIAAVEVAQKTLSYIHAELEQDLRTLRKLDEK